jgi:hypothetical protein
MSIADTDIQIRYSVAAAAGDTTVGTAAGSLGDQVSTTQMPDDVTGNLFPSVTGDESLAGVVKYRCVFVLNNHATLTLQNAVARVASQIAGGSTIAIASDGTAISAKGSASAQAVTIANENTAPAGASAFGLGPVTLGNIGPGQVKGVWVRQTTPANATSPGVDGVDDFYLEIDGDTLP